MNKGVRNLLLVVVAVLAAAAVGGYVGRTLAPGGQPQQPGGSRRPIIQIVRQQQGLPSLADSIANLCPSIAAILPEGRSGPAAAGFAVSPDGWVLTSTSALPTGNAEVHFGAGPALEVSETRSDDVSGLSIVKSEAAGLTPVALADQAFPRVGDFGFAILDPAASGCSAEAAMVSSDFLADGGAANAYIRLQTMGATIPAGAPIISSAGQAFGVVAASGPDGAVIPADVVADIIDELLRNGLSPTTSFGFRAKDFGTALSARLGDSRSTGTAVALVQPKTSAARAGLRAGDIVVAVDGSPVASASELGRAMDGAGKSVSIEIARADQRLQLTIARVPGS